MIGVGEIVIVGGIIILIFGASRIPKLSRALGQSVKEFKKGVQEGEQDENGEDKAAESDE